VAVVGAPNAGKSTLTNALVGRTVTAVSRKTNTTRLETLGALTAGDTQILLVDTPGVVTPESMHGDAHGSRVVGAWRAAASADVIMFLVDAHRQATTPDGRVTRLLARTAEELAAVGPPPPRSWLDDTAPPRPFPPPAVLVLNKTDLLPEATRERHLAALLRELSPLHDFEAAFGVSALDAAGVAPLAAHLAKHAVLERWPLPPERATDAGPAAQALTATREAMFERLHAELPYGVALRHVSWTDFRDGSVRIEQALVVGTDAQRRIVVGRNGATVGQMGIAARKSLEKLFGRRVHLILRVKVARGGRAARTADDDAAIADARTALDEAAAALDASHR
jgi:GTP-binding protein Era